MWIMRKGVVQLVEHEQRAFSRGDRAVQMLCGVGSGDGEELKKKRKGVGKEKRRRW